MPPTGTWPQSLAQLPLLLLDTWQAFCCLCHPREWLLLAPGTLWTLVKYSSIFLSGKCFSCPQMKTQKGLVSLALCWVIFCIPWNHTKKSFNAVTALASPLAIEYSSSAFDLDINLLPALSKASLRVSLVGGRGAYDGLFSFSLFLVHPWFILNFRTGACSRSRWEDKSLPAWCVCSWCGQM